MAKLSAHDQFSGFPFAQIFIICLCRLSEPIAFSSLFPYVYFLTRDFHIAETEADISKYAGYLSSVFALCQVISAIWWSKFSQIHGRKVTIMCGLSGQIISMLILGFSRNYYMALSARALTGLLNGNLPVVRTIIGEIATERRHQAIAFSTFPLVWNLGCIFGPLIGGTLVFPSDDNYYKDKVINTLTKICSEKIYKNWLLDICPFLEPLVHKFPYCLPSIFVSFLLSSSLITFFFFFEETHYRVKYKYDIGLHYGDKILAFLRLRDPNKKRLWELSDYQTHGSVPQEDPFTYDSDNDDNANGNTSAVLDEYDGDDASLTASLSEDEEASFRNSVNNEVRPLLGRAHSSVSRNSLIKNGARRMSNKSIGMLSRTESVTLAKTLSNTGDVTFDENDDTKIPWKAMTHPQCYGPILANVILNLHSVSFDSFGPVFFSNDVAVDSENRSTAIFPFKIGGGLGLSADNVGRLLSVTGFCGILVIVFLYPYIDRNFKATHAFRFMMIPMGLAYFLYPYMIFLAPEVLYRDDLDKLKEHLTPVRDTGLLMKSLYFLMSLRIVSAAVVFPLTTLLTHLGAPPKHRAIVNSLSITASAAAKCIAPMISGYIMSYTTSHNIVWMFFWYLLFVSIIGGIQSFQLVEQAEDESDETSD